MGQIQLVLKTIGATLFLCSIFLFSGCAGTTKYGVAKINTKPSGAEIVNLKDNSHLGQTPAKVSFPGEADTSEFITIQLRKVGYRDRITTFWINKRHNSVTDADREAIDISIELEKK